MDNCLSMVSGGSWIRGITVFSIMGLAVLAGPAYSAESDTSPTPEALSSAFGWKPVPEGRYEPYRTGSIFVVGSEPAKWPTAREQATAWAGTAPALEENPADHLMRKLALIEALVLNATTPDAFETLRKERKELGASVKKLRAMKAGDDSDWQARNASGQLQQVEKSLSLWLADSPAERVQAFREEMESYRPADRAQIAARYGGEEKLAELIKLGQEHARLNTALEAAQQDATLPEKERKLAIRKAGGALGYFYGFNGDDRAWQTAMQDPDLAADFSTEDGGDHRSINVPDLITWAGEAETEKLLLEVYALPVEVQLEPGSRTGGLARRMIVEGWLSPKRAPWSLIGWRSSSVDEESAAEMVALFDVLKKQFPEMAAKKAGGNDWNQKRALGALAYALAITGRMDEAAVLMGDGTNDSGLPYHARMTPSAAVAVWDLVMRTASRGQGLGGWNELINLAGLAGRGEELTGFAAKQAAAAAKDSEEAKVWRSRHAWALISEEKIDEGLALLEPGLETRPTFAEKIWLSEWQQSAGRLLNLAKAVARPQLAKKWSEKLTADFKNASGPIWAEGGYVFETYAAGQLEAGNFAVIEEILRARLAVKPKSRAGGMVNLLADEDAASDDIHVDLQAVTQQLADVMARQGRHAEVLALLAESPNWGRTDVAQLLKNGGGEAWRSLPLVVAETLLATGRGDEAAAIVEGVMIERSGYDPAYALYLRLKGAKAAPFLEKLAAADPYQERPLIWLASVQLSEGKVADAEKTVKRAIAIDPSDGEQPKGDRMRAYAVLRDVAMAKGDAKQVEFLAGVLAAIRRSEDADDIAAAGLIDRAIKEYELALESFADAYCIQSRLARQLAEENRLAEAAEHYKRAFELMPDSFGRVESHCFGCEQAFASGTAQSLAEKVFTNFVVKTPEKPQVHYLLGY
ncbi:MAG: tetratricopeptide repeat protein, partial [Opitutaceae bacterium]|nr:tetratricopeptide repeat protein [Opitutaceae bacterium]